MISCGDDPPTGHTDGPIDTYFPNSVGMLWKYEVYDSLTVAIDTVWVSVTDSTLTRCGYTSYSWRTNWTTRDSVVNRYALIWVDTAMIDFITDTTCEPTILERFVFPLVEGAIWTGPSVFDTCRVTEISTVVVPAGTFRNSAIVEHAWDLDFEGGGNWTETWLAPDVGIAYRHEYQTHSDGATITVLENRIWRLLEYDLSTFRLAQFPNTVGTEWVYEQIDSTRSGNDSITVTFDTVMVTIVDSGRFESGDLYTLWEFVSSIGVDTQYLVTGEERLSFQRDTVFSPFWDLYYEFPLAVGRTWGFDFFAPVPEVLDKELIVTPLQPFESSFHTRIHGGGFNDYWTQEDWLVPGVGIVRSKRWQTGFIPWMHRTWNLIEYHLVQ
jgi:hypothetical protein